MRSAVLRFKRDFLVAVKPYLTGAGLISYFCPMAGIYIHIPFCKQACHYCDFHFSTSLKYKNELVGALIKEMRLQKSYLHEPIETIYFGGGTPSLLSANEINQIIGAIADVYSISADAEIT